jgi:hypothetical protein
MTYINILHCAAEGAKTSCPNLAPGTANATVMAARTASLLPSIYDDLA